MFLNKFNERTRALGYSLFVMGLVTGGLVWAGSMAPTTAEAAAATAAAPAATFPANAGTLGAIPDGSGATTCGADGAARDVTFTVSGLSAPLTNVEVSVTFGAPVHTWRGDLGATLIAPNATSFTLFKYIGSTTAGGCGGSQDFAGPYNFKDSAAGTNIWSVTATPTTAGDYRTTAAGGAGQTNPAPVTNLTAAFAGLSTAQINGTWTLRVTDGGVGDTGAVSAATLTLTGGAAVPKSPVDFNGDGKSDYTVVRNTGGGPGGQVTWYICTSTAVLAQASCGAGSGQGAWGISTDFFTPGDFDGDSKTDIAVWRPGAPGVAAFYILNSNGNTLTTDVFGQTGDDPTVIGDYTGDGKWDRAVYRAGVSAGQQSFWYYRASSAVSTGGSGPFPIGTIIGEQWGQNGDFVAPGDYVGDSRNDFCIQRNAGGGQAIFWIREAANGAGAISNAVFGTPTDVVVPGDYDGDGKTDIATLRGISGQINWFVRPSSAPSTISYLGAWGNSGTDFPTQGDYDGDGKTDIAVWRPNVDPSQNYFYVRTSTTNNFLSAEFGQNGDYPVANYNAH